MENQVVECVSCRKEVQDFLALVCQHDLCINCAVILFQQQRSHSSQRISCQICGEQTRLDAQTALELDRMANQQAKHNRTHNASLQEATPLVFQKVYQKSVESKTCQIHQQSIQFVCFTCRAGFCSQCMLEASHKNHSVKTLKKAVLQIRNLIQTERHQLEGSKQQAEIRIQRIQQSIENVRNKLTQGKERLKTLFQELRNKINQKQNESLRAAEQQSNELIQKGNRNKSQLMKVLSSISSRLQALSSQSSSQVNLLQHYLNRSEHQNHSISIPETASLSQSHFLQESFQLVRKLTSQVSNVKLNGQSSFKQKPLKNQKRNEIKDLQTSHKNQQRTEKSRRDQDETYQTADRSFKLAAALISNLQSRQKFFK